jgi:hypothetical protein
VGSVKVRSMTSQTRRRFFASGNYGCHTLASRPMFSNGQRRNSEAGPAFRLSIFPRLGFHGGRRLKKSPWSNYQTRLQECECSYLCEKQLPSASHYVQCCVGASILRIWNAELNRSPVSRRRDFAGPRHPPANGSFWVQALDTASKTPHRLPTLS